MKLSPTTKWPDFLSPSQEIFRLGKKFVVSAQKFYSVNDVNAILKTKKEQLLHVQVALSETAILADASSSFGKESPFYNEFINEKTSTKKSLIELIAKLQYEVDITEKLAKSIGNTATNPTPSPANTVTNPQSTPAANLEQKTSDYYKDKQVESKVFKLAGDLLLTKMITKKQAKRFAIEITGGVQRTEFKLLYRASRDGLNSAPFHEKVDNKNATVTLIKSDTGAVFGAYTSLSWNKSGKYYEDPSAFLFALIGSKGEERFVVSAPIVSSGIHCVSNELIKFGTKGDDLTLNDGNRGAVYNTSFRKPTDFDKSGNIAGGQFLFKATEIEVYSL